MNRTVVKLSQCAPGTPFRLFAKYRDRTARPRFKVGQHFLGQHELTVVDHDRAGFTRVEFHAKGNTVVVPVWSEMRIAL